MLSRIYSIGLRGINCYIVEVEVDVYEAFDETTLTIVGLPDTAVKESLVRIKSAFKSSGCSFPSNYSIRINLAPADTKKEGPLYDLTIAVGILTALGQVQDTLVHNFLIAGELALDGRVRPIKGVLPMAVNCKKLGFEGIIIPKGNQAEASLNNGIQISLATTLLDVIKFLNGEIPPLTISTKPEKKAPEQYEINFNDIKGQAFAKRAIEIAAAGGHNILMIGPPGSGKSMIAKAIPSILPHMSFEEALQAMQIYSVCGLIKENSPLLLTRPFRAPHHSISSAGLIGGGSVPRPGEVSLAHNGILFLDELPEFSRHTLEVLRQPLEDGVVTISRASSSLSFPAKFMLVAAMNPCPCGFFGDNKKKCICSPHRITNYLAKISGPLLDRIDMQIEVPRLNFKDFQNKPDTKINASIKKNVINARKLQLERFKSLNKFCNAQMFHRDVEKFCKLSDESKDLLKEAMNSYYFSARTYTSILKVARTIADIDNSNDIRPQDIAEGISYRTLDKNSFAKIF